LKSKNIYIEILSLANGLVILYLLSHRLWLLYVSVAIAWLSIFIPKFAYYLGTGLRKIVQTLGDVTNKVILGIVYIFFLTPLAFLRRLFKRKNKTESKTGSFFITKDHQYKPEDFYKQG
jgi:hypothetical protein